MYGAATDSIVFGPFTDKGPWGSGEFWSGTVDGDTVVIEFYKRTDENGQGFEIFEISHILAELDWRLRSNEPDVLNCEVDASCYGDPEKNAVGRILFNDNGPHVCTGTLLNDLAQDQTPYFLTANHCVPTARQSLKLLKYIGFIRQPVVTVAFCEVGSILHRAPISLRRKARTIFPCYGYRTMLLAGRSFPDGPPPPNQQALVFSGFTTPTGISRQPSIHTYEESTGSITNTNENCLGLVNGYEVGWTSGTTEPGSSGSGLFTSNGHYLVGVLSCGPLPPTCNSPWAGLQQVRQLLFPNTTVHSFRRAVGASS